MCRYLQFKLVTQPLATGQKKLLLAEVFQVATQGCGEYGVGITDLLEGEEFNRCRRFRVMARPSGDTAQRECRNRPHQTDSGRLRWHLQTQVLAFVLCIRGACDLCWLENRS